MALPDIPLPQRGGKTSLELAKTPNLDALAKNGQVGLTLHCTGRHGTQQRLACMSIMGYDPRVYYKGRSAIEALSMGINIGWREAVFRCNLVAVQTARCWTTAPGISPPKKPEN